MMSVQYLSEVKNHEAIYRVYTGYAYRYTGTIPVRSTWCKHGLMGTVYGCMDIRICTGYGCSFGVHQATNTGIRCDAQREITHLVAQMGNLDG